MKRDISKTLTFVSFLLSIIICFSEYVNTAQKIELVTPIQIIPIHGDPFSVSSVILGESSVVQYTTDKGKDGTINKTNIKNINEFKFLIKASLSGLDEKKTRKSSELGKEVDRLEIQIREEEKELQEKLARMRSQARK